MAKTKEEMDLERQKAVEELNQLLAPSRPKGLVDGVGGGVSNIVKGAVGAAGVVVMLPVMGLAVGVKQGGILGGALGVTVGAIGGALGAVGLVLGGAVSGITQIGRGVMATPASIMAPREGKWWNEATHEWTLTDMEKEKKSLEGVPADDNDILGKVQEELDQSAELKGDGTVKDMAYYDALGVSSTAEPSAIKRKYYLLARQYHPDRVGKDDKEAADKFKEIAEAYQVLSDPDLRKKYDKEGKEGLSADKTSAAVSTGDLDPAILVAFLFGSDKFNDFVGRMSSATSASVGDSPKISLADARKIQKRRVTRLAVKLIERLTPWIEAKKAGEDVVADVEAQWLQSAVDLCGASFGYQMVNAIGKIYNLVAIQSEGCRDGGQGMPSISKWAAKNHAEMEGKRAKSKNDMDKLGAAMDMMKIQMEAKRQMDSVETPEAKEAIAKETEAKLAGVMLRILWTTVVVDITSALYETAQMIFFDQSVDKETRKFRVEALKKLGQIWMDVAEPEIKDGEEKSARQIYEEAAFAAMVETVKRHDEAAHSSS